MAHGSSQYRMADRLAKGRLAETLIRYKGEGQSYDHMTRLLFAEFGIEVTRNTAELWMKYAEDAAEPTEASA